MPLNTTDLRKVWVQRVAERRTSLDLSQSALDSKMGLARGTTWAVENGRTLSDDLRIALAAALDTTVYELFPYDLDDAAA